MPSFDIISEVDKHELQNSVDQVKKELDNRFDFRGVETRVELNKNFEEIIIAAPSEFQVKQIADIMEERMLKRKIDVQSLEYQTATINVKETEQKIKIKQGIEQDTAKKIIKIIKDSGLKVQAQIQDKKVRVTGKKRDDLQDVIALMRDQKLGIGLQYDNFRD